MKFLPAVLALAALTTEVLACKNVGDRCSKADYDNVTTHCECNTGRLLFCGNDVLKEHYTYEVLLNCPKPKDGGLQCVKDNCAGCKGKDCNKKVKRGITPAYVEEFRSRLEAREPEAVALEESGQWMRMKL